MKTAEIINDVCSNLGIAKADLAKRIGLYPSSLYRKLSNESMTLEELQKCLDTLGVSIEFAIKYPSGNSFSSQINHEQLIDKMDLLKRELEVSNRTAEYHKKLLRELRTELNSAVGYAELCRRHSGDTDSYLGKLEMVHTNMGRTIACALGEVFDEVSCEEDSLEMETLMDKRVLLVDDNLLNREIMREVLVDHGLIVEEADNGIKAISLVQEKAPGYYHFIIMDIEMPEMDGYEATMRIRKLPNRIRANVPVIALTANSFPENREKASAVGMDDFLVKPVNSMRLLRSLSKFI